MGTRVAVLDKGVLQQVGPPQEVYDRPANIFVAQFLGAPPMNMFPPGLLEPGNHLVGVRPEHLTVDGVGPVAARVTLVESLGHEALLTCVTAGELTLVARPGRRGTAEGGRGGVPRAPLHRRHRFDVVTGRRVAP